MKAIILIVTFVVTIASSSFAENYRVPNAVMQQVSSVLGTDMEATQRLPRSTSMQILSQNGEPIIRFTIQDGDIGGAPTDNDPSHSRIFDRPYSERAEVRMDGTMRRNSVYEITFEARFVEGFQGYNETFFQIHTGKKPPLMLFFREFGRTHLLANVMQGCTSTCGHNDQPDYQSHKTIYPRARMFGRWHEYRIVLDTSNRGSISIYLNGAPIVQNAAATFPSQHRPYVRLGVYRSGDLDGNATSIVDYRDLEIIRVGAANG